MGREIRMVPKGWEHPKGEHGYFKPLYDQDYDSAAKEWLDGLNKWESGQDPDRAGYEDRKAQRKYFWEWNDNPPDREYYRPAFMPEAATCFQIYETVSEGTPVSPVFETKEEMLGWLIQKGYSEQAAICFVRDGWACSMAVVPGQGIVKDIETAGLAGDCK